MRLTHLQIAIHLKAKQNNAYACPPNPNAYAGRGGGLLSTVLILEKNKKALVVELTINFVDSWVAGGI